MFCNNNTLKKTNYLRIYVLTGQLMLIKTKNNTENWQTVYFGIIWRCLWLQPFEFYQVYFENNASALKPNKPDVILAVEANRSHKNLALCCQRRRAGPYSPIVLGTRSSTISHCCRIDKLYTISMKLLLTTQIKLFQWFNDVSNADSIFFILHEFICSFQDEVGLR